MRHFIWVFTDCQSAHLGVTSIQRVTKFTYLWALLQEKQGPEDIKLFHAHSNWELPIKTKILQIKKFLALSLSEEVFIMLINVKKPTIVGILTFMSWINFSWVEHEKSFITLGPVYVVCDMIRLKSVCSATETSYKIDILLVHVSSSETHE